MRISDWSSDVCSSDLVAAILAFVDGDGACDIAECGHGAPTGNWIAVVIVAGGSFRRALGWFGGLLFGKAGMALLLEAAFAVLAKAVRSAERRVGKECVSPGRFRWVPAT